MAWEPAPRTQDSRATPGGRAYVGPLVGSQSSALGVSERTRSFVNSCSKTDNVWLNPSLSEGTPPPNFSSNHPTQLLQVFR